MIDPFDAYPPPLVLTSDMILVGAACPPEPIRRTFPHLALRTLGGKALLGIWFSRVLQIRAGHDGSIRLTPSEAPNDLPYQELNVAVLLRGRRLFVPGIYTTSELTLRLGHRYGMPKEPAAMSYHAGASEVRSEVVVRGTTSHVAARPLPSGRWLGRLARRTLPWWSWRTQFPSGSSIKGHVEGAEGARLVRITHGRLALDAPWLPHSTSLWPIGLHVPRQTMTLPDPDRGQP